MLLNESTKTPAVHGNFISVFIHQLMMNNLKNQIFKSKVTLKMKVVYASFANFTIKLVIFKFIVIQEFGQINCSLKTVINSYLKELCCLYITSSKNNSILIQK